MTHAEADRTLWVPPPECRTEAHDGPAAAGTHPWGMEPRHPEDRALTTPSARDASATRSTSAAHQAPPARKHFVLDTNVLLHNPQSIFKFEEHEVVIPLTVIEELDKFKKNNDETGRNSRQVIRSLDKLRSFGHLFEGVPGNTPDGEPVEAEALVPNQFVILADSADPGHAGLARVLGNTGHLIPVTGPRKPVYGVMARNVQQTMALDLLLDDDVKLVTLIGPAGTGKTLMAIAAGMQKVLKEERLDKLLVARPIMPLGRDIGYLPGDKDEKLSMWMQPIFDNVGYLLSPGRAATGRPTARAPSNGWTS